MHQLNYNLFATLARTKDDLRAAQRLRYDVFVGELGGDGPDVDHELQLERDHFDPFAKHLLLRDRARRDDDQVVGTYRMMTQDMAARAGGFYCADEYDLAPLLGSGRRVLELGRSCLHADYRGGAAMLPLWGALSAFVKDEGIDVIFGVGSFHGTDIGAVSQALGLLHDRHLAPPHLRVTAKGDTVCPLDTVAGGDIDRITAVRQMPSLLKGYLRLGATVGQGAFVDYAFNTIDVCLILEKDAISALHQQIYTKGTRNG